MDIILLEHVERLGKLGDMVQVKNGYARNFLLPQGKALRANKHNIAQFEARRDELEKTNREKLTQAQDLADDIEGTSVNILRMASQHGQLYGSVSARDVASALQALNYKIQSAQVLIGQSIKTIGVHDVKVRFHPEVAASIKVSVAKNEEDALIQLNDKAEIVETATVTEESEANTDTASGDA